MLYRHRRDVITYRRDHPYDALGALFTYTGDGRRRQTDAEQVRHHLSQSLLRKKLKMQKVDHDGRDPRAIFNLRRDALGKAARVFVTHLTHRQSNARCAVTSKG